MHGNEGMKLSALPSFVSTLQSCFISKQQLAGQNLCPPFRVIRPTLRERVTFESDEMSVKVARARAAQERTMEKAREASEMAEANVEQA